MHPLELGRVQRIALLGAHCDDLAIGAGASLLQLCRARPGITISALVLSGAGTAREAEERAALADFCPGARLSVQVGGLPDGRFPAYWERAKEAVAGFRCGLGDAEPDLVLAPQPNDAHQDHRLLAELVTQEFRDHTVWGYEILKYESDLPAVGLYLPATADIVAEKVELLHRHYPSQHRRSWFDAEAFTALLRIRGVQCQQRYAEAFCVPKLTLTPTDRAGDADRPAPAPIWQQAR